MNPTMKSLQNRVQSLNLEQWNRNFLEASPVIIRNPSLKFKPSLVQACNFEEIPSLVEWHMNNSKVVKFVAKMGFERGLVSETLKNVLAKNKSAKFDSCFELVESILQTESNLASLCGELRALSLG